MNDPLLQNIAEQLKQAEPELERAKVLIQMAQNAGEDVSAQRARLMALENKVNKWRAQLIQGGYIVKKDS